MADLTGQTFDGFEILSKLGQGGMGAVYKARQVSLNRFVALKVMSNTLAEDQEFIERFKREATTAAQFKHPNIVQVHAAGESSGTHYMAMEFVEGRTLREHIRSHGRLDPQEAIAITLHVAEGLKYAWNKSRMIHRDIKPDNVFLSQSGEVLVGDLGLAKSAGSGSTELTASGAMMGSPHYISPEQAMAVKDIDFRADIYSLGCTLYHMLTGRTAYEADSSMVLMMKHVHDPAPDIFEALPECPRKLGVMLGRMMAKNRDDRPSSYDELITGLWEANENLSGDTEIGRPPAAQSLTPTAVGHVAAVPTVAAAPRKQVSPGMIYGIAGAAVVLLLTGLFLWSPWKIHTSPSHNSEWKNLIPNIDPKRDGIAGEWKVQDGHLLCAAHTNWSLCEVPVSYNGGNYDLRFRMTRGEGDDVRVFFLFRKGGTGGTVAFDYSTPGQRAKDVKVAGLTCVKGQNLGRTLSRNETRRERSLWLPKGQEKTVLIQVRDGGMVVSLDSEEVFRWEGKWEDVSQDDGMAYRDNITRQMFGVCVFRGEAVFSAIEMREVSDNNMPARGTLSTTPSLQHPAASPSAALQLLGNVFTNSVGAEMVYIPPGEFMMGSTKEEQAWAMQHGAKEEQMKREGEAPRKTTIKQGFWVGRTEVTVGQWKQFVKETSYVTDGEKKGESNVYPGPNKTYALMKGKSWRDPNFGFELQENHPVCCISWNDAEAFCEWLTKREQKVGRVPIGLMVRLPTEAEWEYACRAGRQTKFWWGDSMEDGKGRLTCFNLENGYQFIAPVDSFGARGRNRFGLADMLGNVFEWCLDGFDATQAHEDLWTGYSGLCVLRGGSFGNIIGNCRCAHRHSARSDASHAYYGFRICYGVDVSGVKTPTTSTSPASAPKEGGILAPSETRVATLTTNPKVGEVYTLSLGSNVTMELMGIPPGEFMLGSTKEERDWAIEKGATEEEVKHEGRSPSKVAVKQGFWMSRTEATVAQWKQFVKETGYVTDAEKKGGSYGPRETSKSWELVKGMNWKETRYFSLTDSQPVTCISWNDAISFCQWLTQREQKVGRVPQSMIFRLPTEAEWEYACRAGNQTKFWWGDSKEDGTTRLNWCLKNWFLKDWPQNEDGHRFVAPVDSYGPRGRNQFGLADMLGNVWEWCLDDYDPTQAHESFWKGNCGQVLRGGSFFDNPGRCRCAYRRGDPFLSYCNYGFRIVLAVDVASGSEAGSISPRPLTPKEDGILAPPETRVPALTTNPKVGEVYTLPIGSNVTMELMGIPPGEFMMGSTKEEQAWAVANGLPPRVVKNEGEAPRRVTIQQGFWMGRTEVTVGQWKQFIAATGYITDAEKAGEATIWPGAGKLRVLTKGVCWRNPSPGVAARDSDAVSLVSSNDAMAFFEWLTDRAHKAGVLTAGMVLRLPMETEWEYACRAGTQTRFWWGDSIEDGKGRLNWSEKEDGFEFVAPVDSFGARGRNRFGLADMLGNLCEMCFNKSDEPRNQEALRTKYLGQRSLCGGSFVDNASHCRCASRMGAGTASRSDNAFGFRIVVDVAR